MCGCCALSRPASRFVYAHTSPGVDQSCHFVSHLSFVLLKRPGPQTDVEITEGSHVSRDAINRQLQDKERVAAALENAHLLRVVNEAMAIKDDDQQ